MTVKNSDDSENNTDVATTDSNNFCASGCRPFLIKTFMLKVFTRFTKNIGAVFLVRP